MEEPPEYKVYQHIMKYSTYKKMYMTIVCDMKQT